MLSHALFNIVQLAGVQFDLDSDARAAKARVHPRRWYHNMLEKCPHQQRPRCCAGSKRFPRFAKRRARKATAAAMIMRQKLLHPRPGMCKYKGRRGCVICVVPHYCMHAWPMPKASRTPAPAACRQAAACSVLNMNPISCDT